MNEWIPDADAVSIAFISTPGRVGRGKKNWNRNERKEKQAKRN